MSVELHIKNVCQSAYSELRRISTIRHLFLVDSTKTLVSAFSFVLSGLDYCNSLLSGCPKHPELGWSYDENIFHPSSIQARIEYKLSTLCHSFFSDTAPVYLSDLLRVFSPSRQVRSSSASRTLRIPHIKTKTFGRRSFSHAAPSV